MIRLLRTFWGEFHSSVITDLWITAVEMTQWSGFWLQNALHWLAFVGKYKSFMGTTMQICPCDTNPGHMSPTITGSWTTAKLRETVRRSGLDYSDWELLWTWLWYFGFHKRKGISWLGKLLSVSRRPCLLHTVKFCAYTRLLESVQKYTPEDVIKNSFSFHDMKTVLLYFEIPFKVMKGKLTRCC